MGVKVSRKIIFGNYGEDISMSLSMLRSSYLVRSMFAMYIFVAIIVVYNILVALQMIIFYINLRCFD